jgi:hypothetical protein
VTDLAAEDDAAGIEDGRDRGDAQGEAPGEGVEKGVGGDLVQPRVGSPAFGSRLPHHPDQPAVLEPLHEVGNSRTVQAGQRFELGGRQRSLSLDEFEGEPVVDGARGARRGRPDDGRRGRH